MRAWRSAVQLGELSPRLWGEWKEQKISVFAPGRKERKGERKENEEVRKLFTFDKSF